MHYCKDKAGFAEAGLLFRGTKNESESEPFFDFRSSSQRFKSTKRGNRIKCNSGHITVAVIKENRSDHRAEA